MTLQPLIGLTPKNLRETLLYRGVASYRAAQIWRWVYADMVDDFGQMTNLPVSVRRELGQWAMLSTLRCGATQVDDKGDTTKALLLTRNQLPIETVLMRYRASDSSRERNTICVSSQVGCAVGCPFCVTGTGGLRRSLTPGEIVEQYLHFARLLRSNPVPGRVTNVVFMGQGEPLANLANVLDAISILNDQDGLNLGARHITISTAGLAPQIVELSRFPLQVGLAVSLHSANDELRNWLVPCNKAYPLAVLLAACQEYVRRTNRRITFEYALIRGINDNISHAKQLASLASQIMCHVNLLPLNSAIAGFAASTPDAVRAFQAELENRGVNATIRAPRGTHISAACGQLGARMSSAHEGRADDADLAGQSSNKALFQEGGMLY